jgi:hypothetical protein
MYLTIGCLKHVCSENNSIALKPSTIGCLKHVCSENNSTALKPSTIGTSLGTTI